MPFIPDSMQTWMAKVLGNYRKIILFITLFIDSPALFTFLKEMNQKKHVAI
jgi:hypothetical protein